MDILARQYAEALWPDEWQVLGIWLKPMTIGHALLLTRVGNPFAPFAEIHRPATGVDLAQALWICSRDQVAAARRLGNALCRLWMRLCVARFALAGVKGRALSWLAWHGYLDAQQTPPPFWIRSDSDPRYSQAPLLALLVQHRCMRCGDNLSSALGFGLRLAFLDFAVWSESQGAIELKQPGDPLSELAPPPERAPEGSQSDPSKPQENSQSQGGAGNGRPARFDQQSNQGPDHASSSYRL